MPAPGIIHIDAPSTAGGPSLLETSRVGMLAVTERGPLATATLVRSLAEFERIFGSTKNDAWYQVRLGFQLGISDLYVSRLAHYSDVEAGTTACDASSLAVNDGSADLILTFDAKSPGTWGNDLKVQLVDAPRASTTLAADTEASDTSIVVASKLGMRAGQVISVDGAEWVKILSITTTIVDGAAVHTVALTAALTSAYSEGDVVVSQEFDVKVFVDETLMETFSGVDLEAGSPYNIETVLANSITGSNLITATIDATNTLRVAGYGSPASTYYPPAMAATALTGGVAEGTIDGGDVAGSSVSRVGIQAFDAVPGIRLIFAAVGDAGRGAQAHAAMLDFADNHRFCCALLEGPLSNGAAAAAAARATNGMDSANGALFGGTVIVKVPGTSETTEISPLAGIAGMIATLDAPPQSRPWQPAAGVYGRFGSSVVGVGTQLSDADRAMLDEADINPIHATTQQGVMVFGARSLSSNPDFQFYSARRNLESMKALVDEQMLWVAFAPNNDITASSGKAQIEAILNARWVAGGLKGSLPEDAYYVLFGEADGVQSPADTEAGRIKATIGVALVKPGVFVEFTWQPL